MINDEKLKNMLAGGEMGVPSVRQRRDIDNMSVEELLALRAEIDARLPATSLKDMNLEKELIIQYLKVVELQKKVLEDDETPANQLAQVANAVAGTLQNLITMQSKFHNVERFKQLENLMIKHMKSLPLEVAEAFINEYEQLEAQ